MTSANPRRVGAAALVSILAVLPITTAQADPASAPTTSTETVNVTVAEGTNIAPSASPKDGTIVMDLQGQLFTVPRDGGTATAIGDNRLEPYWPSWSPDGRQIAFQSFADGMFHVRLISPDGKSTCALTSGEYDDTYPSWSPDGKQIAFSSTRSGTEDIWTVDVRGGSLHRITTAKTDESQPAWSPDGKQIAYTQGNTIESVDIASGKVTTLVQGSQQAFISTPSWSTDGKSLSYLQSGQRGSTLWAWTAGASHQVGTYDDVFPFPARWTSPTDILYGANGKIVVSNATSGQSRDVPFKATFALHRDKYPPKVRDFDSTKPQQAKGIVGPQLSPDGKSVAFKALNDLWVSPLGGTPKKVTDDSYYEIDPAWSRDGAKLAYSSDKAGTEDIYVLDLATRKEQRVTSLDGAEVGAAFSPDGKVIAFQDEKYQTLTVDIASGKVTKVLGGGAFSVPGKVSWSADGKTLALAVSGNDRNLIELVDVATGKARTVDPAPWDSVSTRGDDGPIFSPDGHWLAFSMDSVINVLPVGPDGTPTGRARRLTSEASDAPSWSGDSKTILYLHNGNLRTVPVTGGKPTDVTPKLTYTQQVPTTKVLIHAGRLWDGRNAEPKSNVDILVVGDRIQSIEPHQDGRDTTGWQVIDASGQTVTPGLWDIHNHQQMKSKIFGDRQGRLLLSYGITSTRSTGDEVYRGVEDRESLASGARVGPRFFMTGEMLEGTRFSWEFARPVRDQKQLDLELTRVHDLDYDLVKTYVRFDADFQAQVTAFAHKQGVNTTSHYLYPGIGNGVDMKEHLYGPTKWGFGFSRESSVHGPYNDVIQLNAQGHFPFSTTLFSAASVLADDPAMENDPRVAALFTTQDKATLHAKVLCALGTGPCGFLDGNAAGAKRDVEVIKNLLAAGGSVLAGTDAPLDVTALALQWNLRAMAKYGVTPFQVLQSATLLPARQLGVEKDLGSVETGKLADLLIVNGDPSKDINTLSNVRWVLKNGTPHTVEDLTAPFRK
ncbi:DPP IV N-terminal domain-containing protein [Actinokineospora inagensis]|uniref:DPP IV N-terminal domain-containing protein n=1 Tax=Actinokineospora inagensis TaxID=103730 RepID=UPI00047C1CAE|nr:DPP IV N-terminal domain-containing protein [Actinokineospora inagensis]